MNARTKNILHTSIITITVVIVMVIARQGFAWTNPAGAPPFSNSIISTLGNNIGVGTMNPNSKLEVLAPTVGSNVGDTVEVQRLNSSNGNNNYLDVRNMRTAAGTDWTTAGTRIQEKVDATWMGYIQFNGDSNNGGISFGTGLTTTAPGNVGERMRINSAGNVGVGVTSPDSNYKITTSGGGIKAETNTAQPAGYFNNTGGGSAITIGTGGITLGGVNQTSWPSGSDSTKVLKTGDTMTGALSIVSSGGEYVGDGTSKMWLGGSGGINYIESGNNAWNTSPVLYFTGYNGSAGNFDFNGNVGIGIGSGVPGYKLDVAGTIRTQGDFLANANYGLGLVGLYDPTKYRNVYSMGTSYRLPADGTGPGNLYGIAMTYEPNYGGVGNNAQAVAGLGHQFLFMSNGVTQTAIGTGIYTVGNAGIAGTATVNSLIAGGGSSSNWAGVNTSSINALNSIYSYGSICTGNASGACSAANGTVLGINNTAAANNIPNSGAVLLNSGNVGVGTTAPASKLAVGGAGYAGYGIYTASGMYAENSNIAVYGSGSNFGLYGYSSSGTGVNGLGAINGVNGHGSYIGVRASADAGNNYDFYGDGPKSYFAGSVGIGTQSPAYKLSVAGTVESTTGGFRFPDGTTQTTAAASSAFRGAYVYNNASSQAAGAGVFTTVFNAEAYDTDNIHDNVTNNMRLTVPAGVTKIRLSGQVALTNTGGQSYGDIGIDKNGGGYGIIGGQDFFAPSGLPIANVTSGVIPVTPGDYFTLTGWKSDARSIIGGSGYPGYWSWFSMEIVQ